MKLLVMLAFLANDGTVLQLRGPYQMTMRDCDALAEITAKLFVIPPTPPGYDPRTREVQCYPWKGRML